MKTALEALFIAMLNEEWFTDSDGNVDSPMGYFGYVTNRDIELKELYEAFSDTIEAYGKPNDADVIGSFFVSIDSNGLIHIDKCPNHYVARHKFNAVQTLFNNWTADS